MPDKIQPALTPEEWAQLAESGGGVAESVHRYFSGSFIGIHIGEPQLMALANDALPDDDPRKITREDVVDELDAYHAAVIFARWCEDNGMPDKRIEAKERAARHRQRASKLAALLPPDERSAG